jgi:hypothetical protein
MHPRWDSNKNCDAKGGGTTWIGYGGSSLESLSGGSSPGQGRGLPPGLDVQQRRPTRQVARLRALLLRGR